MRKIMTLRIFEHRLNLGLMFIYYFLQIGCYERKILFGRNNRMVEGTGKKRG